MRSLAATTAPSPLQIVGKMRALLVFVWIALLMSFFGLSSAQITAPVGIPFITVYATTSSSTATWEDAGIKANVVQWLTFRYPTAFPGFGPSRVMLYNVNANISGTEVTSLDLSLDNAFYNNGFIYTYLAAMLPSLRLDGVLGSNITVFNATLIENPSPSVEITFDPFSSQYNDTWTGPIRMYLDFSPQVGTNVSIALNSTNVVVDPWPLVVTFPDVTATFRLRSTVPGTYSFSRNVIGGTDSSARYDFNVFTPVWTNSYLANLTIIPPNPSIPNYASQPSDVFTVIIPNTYLFANPRVVLNVRATPAGMTISTPTIAMSARGAPYTFFCTGPIGTFTLLYSIGPPTNPQNQNNNFFYSPTITHTITFQQSLNVSSAGIPDAFMAAPPASSVYGGAFSVPVPFHIQRSPKKGLTVSIDVEDGSATPSVLTFAPNGVTTLTYKLRALTIGTKMVRYTLGGLSAGDYSAPSTRLWRVFGPNPNCLKRSDSVGCYSTNGCQWNAMALRCSNRTLPIFLSLVDQLFDGEMSKVVTLTLPTPVRSQLVITFIASARLTFFPHSVTLNVGQTQANYTMLPALLPKEQRVSQGYYYQLSGLDANYFTQQTQSIQIRSKIVCTCQYPWSFYVGTKSTNFTITCDTPPEVDVTFTPVAVGQSGIAFVLHPPLSTSGAALKMLPDSTSAQFHAISTASRNVGNFTVSFIIGGTNAARYATIAPVPIRILPLGFLNAPPSIFLVEKTPSPPLSIDISILPEDLVYVDIQVFSNETGVPVPLSVVNCTPTHLVYNTSLRNFIQITAPTPGYYYFVFNISGNIANYFVPPSKTYFTITPRHDGNAFTSRLQLGYLPRTACRVNVGRNSEFFKGQNALDAREHFCDKYTTVLPNSTYDCESLPTELDCKDALRDTGNLCVWNVSSCILLTELQGNVTDVVYGSGFTVLLTKNKAVYTIGSPQYGQLGHVHNYAARVPLNDNITAVVAGTAHVVALSESGYVYAWGNNNQGQLGIGSNTQQLIKPTKLNFPKGENITCISAGALHTAATSLSGIAYVWGSNLFGQLGNKGTFQAIARTPVAIGRDQLNGDSAIAIQCGEYHTMVATAFGAYTFGLNTQGQLGRPGFDEYKPAQPILWTPSRFVPKPNYPSYVVGQGTCPP